MSQITVNHQSPETRSKSPLALLNPNLIRQVDEALAKVGQYGEVRLVVVKGRLKFIQIMQSQTIK